MPTLGEEAIAAIKSQHPKATRKELETILRDKLQQIRERYGSGILTIMKEFIRASGDIELAISNCRNMEIWHQHTTPPRISKDGRTVLPYTFGEKQT